MKIKILLFLAAGLLCFGRVGFSQMVTGSGDASEAIAASLAQSQRTAFLTGQVNAHGVWKRKNATASGHWRMIGGPIVQGSGPVTVNIAFDLDTTSNVKEKARPSMRSGQVGAFSLSISGSDLVFTSTDTVETQRTQTIVGFQSGVAKLKGTRIEGTFADSEGNPAYVEGWWSLMPPVSLVGAE